MMNKEEREAADLFDLVDEYTDQEKIYSFEGDRGIKALEKIISVLGYDDKFGGYLENFFRDNSGAIEAVIEWIKETDAPEWKKKVKEELFDPEEEEDEG